MDILDIDEELRDDSFICLEDKTHDDVSNILQQWKSNSLQQNVSDLDHSYQLNSRTFTRPKRRFSQNIEPQTITASSLEGCDQKKQQANDAPVVSLRIGGLVTNTYKSFLQDTSPPPSISSSIDVSIDRINNSLITSADFANVNFLQSTQSLNFGDYTALIGNCFHKEEEPKGCHNSLNQLERLTLSSDDALIKDSQIAHIDDISLILSKTASECSTMDNSTESIEAENAIEIGKINFNCTRDKECDNILDKTILLSGTKTFSSENKNDSYGVGDFLNVTKNIEEQIENISKGEILENLIVPKDQMIASDKKNSPFKCKEAKAKNSCENPESFDNTLSIESTPQVKNMYHNKHQFVTAISPIISYLDERKTSRELNETFDKTILYNTQIKSNDIFGAIRHDNSVEMSENIENPNNTYVKSVSPNMNKAEMQNVIDIAQAEAELLACNDNEEEFDHMLNEFSKVALNTSQLKIKQSVEFIKKRFSYGLNTDSSEFCIEKKVDNSDLKSYNYEPDVTESSNSSYTTHTLRSLDNSMNLRQNVNVFNDGVLDPSISSTPTVKPLENHRGRLLNRRSRMYDNNNLVAGILLNGLKEAGYGVCKTRIKTDESINEKTEGFERDSEKVTYGMEVCTTVPKLSDKRSRDRDRFKTIKITKPNITKNTEILNEDEINVPCIDKTEGINQQNTPLDTEIPQHPQRSSRRVKSSLSSDQSPPNEDYAIQKRTNDKKDQSYNMEVQIPSTGQHIDTINEKARPRSRLAPRSLSRPRYIAGLQKLSIANKATSANELEKEVQLNQGIWNTDKESKIKMDPRNFKKKQVHNGTSLLPEKVGSPMGVKSKSFHNLSTNVAAQVNAYSFKPLNDLQMVMGKKKKNVLASKLTDELKVPKKLAEYQKREPCDLVFKIPRLVPGIPGSSVSGLRRGGLTRPSSGYYSLNVQPKNSAYPIELELDNGRHSPTGSLSSASSRGSISGSVSNLKPSKTTTATIKLSPNLKSTTTDSTGMSKPSGLRPPSTIKRSGLPRPSSTVKR